MPNALKLQLGYDAPLRGGLRNNMATWGCLKYAYISDEIRQITEFLLMYKMRMFHGSRYLLPCVPNPFIHRCFL